VLTSPSEDLVAQELGEELARTKTELESSLQELEQRHALIGALETQQGNMSMELQRSQEQMAEISGQRTQLESRMRNLENELAEREENHQTLIGQQRSSWERMLREERSKSQQTQEDLQNRLRSIELAAKTELEPVESLRAEIDRLRREVQSLRQAKTSMTEKIKSHEAQLLEKVGMIEDLSDQVQDLTIENSIRETPPNQVPELMADIEVLRKEKRVMQNTIDSERTRLVAEKQRLKDQVSKLEQEKLTSDQKLNQQVSRLEQEKRTLNQRISDLEKVSSIEGVVICVDLSASLDAAKVKLAKEAFRTIISGIRTRNAKTHVGVVVQASSVSNARNISQVDLSTESTLNSDYGGGVEGYHTALDNVNTMLLTFRSSHPKAQRRIILIGDGNAVGGFPDWIINSFRNGGVPIHNVVVGSGNSSSYKTQTSDMSSKTNGQDFAYSGVASSLSSPALLGRYR